MSNAPGIYVGPDFEGRIPRSELLLESAGFVFGLPPSYVVQNEWLILSICADDFCTEIVLRNGKAFLHRNGQTVSVDLAVSDSGWFTGSAFLGVSWSTTSLIIAAGRHRRLEVDECPTHFTLPPRSLADWARRQSLIPTVTYENKRVFQDTVLNGLRSLAEKIRESGMHHAFWDGRQVGNRKPKLEIHCHPTIHALLHDFSMQKNLDVVREETIGSGSVDFTIKGTLASGERVQACVEVKNAHSDDVEHGLHTQLPEYMRRKSTDIGFYCVLWFGSEHFRSPPVSASAFRAQLGGLIRDSGLYNIGIELLDLTPVPPPSARA